MFRHSSKFGARKSSHPGLKLFIYGLIAGAILVFVLMRLTKTPEPLQLVINTPTPTVAEKPEQYTWSDSGNIGVLIPASGDTIQSPLEIKGQAKVSENILNLRLKADKKGGQPEIILVETTTTAAASEAGQHGAFEASLQFKTDVKTGTLEVFGKSAKDGTELDKVIIPVKFR